MYASHSYYHYIRVPSLLNVEGNRRFFSQHSFLATKSVLLSLLKRFRVRSCGNPKFCKSSLANISISNIGECASKGQRYVAGGKANVCVV